MIKGAKENPSTTSSLGKDNSVCVHGGWGVIKGAEENPSTTSSLGKDNSVCVWGGGMIKGGKHEPYTISKDCLGKHYSLYIPGGDGVIVCDYA